jgi:hypothetical protein
MPVHDWSGVDAGLWQDFRSSWIVEISSRLNQTILPRSHYALLAPAAFKVEEIVPAPGTFPFREPWLETPTDDCMEFYRLRKSHIVVRRSSDDRAAAVIDILSAGDKSSGEAVSIFSRRAADLLRNHIHLLVIDLFPPTPRDPCGIHKAIWDEVEPGPYELPSDRPLTLAAYVADEPPIAYLRHVGIGQTLPNMPAYLDCDSYVPVPLESTYQTTWESCPEDMREAVEKGADFDAEVR